jgi:FKBP-type peptidyl-prolyl cis-trans isomerase 2
MGDHTFQPGMELALYGLKAGDAQTLTLTPEQAYGDHDPGLVQHMPLSDFSGRLQPEVEQTINFSLPNGCQFILPIRLPNGQRRVHKVTKKHPTRSHRVQAACLTFLGRGS